MAAEHPPDRDEDLELALRLHRELNAVPRRQRQPVRTQAATAALKTLSKKHQRVEEEETSSSESEAGERSPHGSEQKRRRAAAVAANGGAAPSDNDSGSKRKRQREGQGPPGSKKLGRGRVGRRPQHVAAAEEAKTKAAQWGQEDGARTHVKCFYAGLQHGCWLATEALASRASLAAAVNKAFLEDEVACSGDAATVVFVTADKQSLEFPAVPQPPNGEQQAAGDSKWEAAAQRASRVYVR